MSEEAQQVVIYEIRRRLSYQFLMHPSPDLFSAISKDEKHQYYLRASILLLPVIT